ncbi:hypothetical protein D3C72_1078380 [compost metagenome]
MGIRILGGKLHRAARGADRFRRARQCGQARRQNDVALCPGRRQIQHLLRGGKRLLEASGIAQGDSQRFPRGGRARHRLGKLSGQGLGLVELALGQQVLDTHRHGFGGGG